MVDVKESTIEVEYVRLWRMWMKVVDVKLSMVWIVEDL